MKSVFIFKMRIDSLTPDERGAHIDDISNKKRRMIYHPIDISCPSGPSAYKIRLKKGGGGDIRYVCYKNCVVSKKICKV